MSHGAQIVEVKIIKGGRVGETAQELAQRFVGEPLTPLTEEEKQVALNVAIERAVNWLQTHLDYGEVPPDRPDPMDE